MVCQEEVDEYCECDYHECDAYCFAECVDVHVFCPVFPVFLFAQSANNALFYIFTCRNINILAIFQAKLFVFTRTISLDIVKFVRIYTNKFCQK